MVIYYLQAVHHTSSDTTWTLSEAISKPVSQVAAGGVIFFRGTVKPLYSEQSRDPKKMFTIQRCSPKRGDICSCTHDVVPAIQCTHIKTVPSLLVRDSSGGRAIFHDSFSLG